MAADQEKEVSIEDENRNKRVREEEVKDVKEFKKVKTGEENKEEKQEEKEEEEKKDEKEAGKQEDSKEKEQAKKEDVKENSEEKETSKEKNSEDTKDSKESEKKDPQNENESNSDAKEKSTSEESKPKFVFGASSSFGSGFKVAGSAPLKSEEAKKEVSKEKGTPKPSAFGSGLSFGSGFGVLKKSDKEDSKDKTPEAGSDTRERSRESSSSANAVKLQKQDVKSGEESEETIYQANAKLYQLADIEVGWKERGIGVIKVNKNVNTGKSRLVMRSRGMLKVILNLSLVKGFTVQKGFVGSMQGEKFIRMVTQDDNKAPIQTAVKTGSKETAEELYDSIVKLIPK